MGDEAEVSRRPVASEVFASRRPWPGHASRSVKSSTALRRRSPGTGGSGHHRRRRLAPWRRAPWQRNFWLVQPFSMNGATRWVRGRMTPVVPGIRVGPPRTPSAGGPVRAAGASGARVTHDSERVRRPEDAVAPFAQGWSSSRRGACRWRCARAFRRARAGGRARASASPQMASRRCVAVMRGSRPVVALARAILPAMSLLARVLGGP